MVPLSETVEFVNGQRGLVKNGRDRLRFEYFSSVARNGRCSTAIVAKAKMGATRSHDPKARARQFPEHLLSGYAWQASHRSLARDRDLDALEARSCVALRNLRTLFGEVFKTQPDGIARVLDGFFEGIPFGHDARQRWDDDGESTHLVVRLQDHGVASRLGHTPSLALFPSQPPFGRADQIFRAPTMGPRSSDSPTIRACASTAAAAISSRRRSRYRSRLHRGYPAACPYGEMDAVTRTFHGAVRAR